jgi:hypothetical protein
VSGAAGAVSSGALGHSSFAAALLEASELPSLRRAFFTSLGGSVNPSSSYGGSGAFALLSTDNDGCTTIVVGASHGDPAAVPHSLPHNHSAVPLPQELVAAFSHSATSLSGAAAPTPSITVAMLHPTSLDFVPSAVLQSRAQQEAGSRKADLTQGESDGLGGRIIAKSILSSSTSSTAPHNRVKRIYKGVGGYSGEVEATTNARDGYGVMRFTTNTPASLPLPIPLPPALPSSSSESAAAAIPIPPAFPITSLAGGEYEGSWAKDGFGGGKGTLKLPGGACYEGPFDGGLPHGKHGIMSWPEGYLPQPVPALQPAGASSTTAAASRTRLSRASSASFSEHEDENGSVKGDGGGAVSSSSTAAEIDEVAALLSSVDPCDIDAVLLAQSSPLVNFSKPPTAAKKPQQGAAAVPPLVPLTARKSSAPSSARGGSKSSRQPQQQQQEDEGDTLPDGSLKPPPLPKPLSIASWRWARYEGPWYKGCPHTGEAEATAKIIFSNGAIYVGEVHQGRIQGKGKLQALVANIHTQLAVDGTWVENGLLHGPLCTITVASTPSAPVQGQESFAGGFERGIRTGQGTHHARDGSYFCGEYFNGRRNGLGVAKSGSYVYEGRFVSDVRAGKGCQVYPDGSCYVGSWLDNKPHGEGFKKHPDGTEERGIWRRGRLLPTATTSSPRSSSPVSGSGGASGKPRSSSTSAPVATA